MATEQTGRSGFGRRWYDTDPDGPESEPVEPMPIPVVGRRKYDNRTGMPIGEDGDRLYGRRASDPR